MDAMPGDARPDRCGLIFCVEGDESHPNPFARFCVLARPVGKSRAPRCPLVRQVSAMLVRQGTCRPGRTGMARLARWIETNLDEDQPF